MIFTYNDVLSWSEVMKNYSKEMIWLIAQMQCEWDVRGKCKGMFKDMKANMLLYTPLAAYTHNEMKETKSRWIQILRGVK